MGVESAPSLDETLAGAGTIWFHQSAFVFSVSSLIHAIDEDRLGKTFLAYDNLGRQVLLKELHERHTGDPKSRLQLMFEAEITAELEHPGIVPVYSSGHYADGRPFYTMRFLRGQSLQGAIDDYHERNSLTMVRDGT